jgi:predicted transcriptional regulator
MGFFKLPRFTKVIKILAKKDNLSRTQIARKTNTVYSHVKQICDELEKKGLIVTTRQGRYLYNKLTNKGRETAKAIEKIEQNLSD